MSKESLSPTYLAHKKRADFIEKAVAEGMLDKIRSNERNQNIGLIYYLSEDLTGEDIGKIYPKSSGEPLTSQRVGQISTRLIKQLQIEYSNLHPRTHYSLKELLVRKLEPLGKITSQIKRTAKNNIVNTKTIWKIGISPQELISKRNSLRKQGIKVPLIQPYANFETRIEAAKDNGKKLKKILHKPSNESVRGYMDHHRRDKIKILAYLSSVLEEGGFYPPKSLKLFAKKLLEKDIPLRILEDKKFNRAYYIVYAIPKQKDKIIEALKNDPDLQKFKENPVKQICGSLGPIPTVTKLMKGGEYDAVRNTITRIIGYWPRNKEHYVTIEDFLSGCPVPIYRHLYYLRILKDKISDLEAFLRSKKSNLIPQTSQSLVLQD